MTRQPSLFDPCLATVTTRQPDLYDGLPVVSDERCECGRYLVETASGYWTCPAGCGKLLPTWTLDSAGISVEID